MVVLFAKAVFSPHRQKTENYRVRTHLLSNTLKSSPYIVQIGLELVAVPSHSWLVYLFRKMDLGGNTMKETIFMHHKS